jgi:hypothetical protein
MTTTQFNIRIDDATRARLDRIGAHLGKKPAGVVRFLIWKADLQLAGGAPLVSPPSEYACERMRVTEDGLRQLIAAGRISDPPTREEVDNWVSDETLASPRDILERLARARANETA